MNTWFRRRSGKNRQLLQSSSASQRDLRANPGSSLCSVPPHSLGAPHLTYLCPQRVWHSVSHEGTHTLGTAPAGPVLHPTPKHLLGTTFRFDSVAAAAVAASEGAQPLGCVTPGRRVSSVGTAASRVAWALGSCCRMVGSTRRTSYQMEAVDGAPGPGEEGDVGECDTLLNPPGAESPW